MNNDILFEIMKHMTIIDLYYFSQTSQYHNQLCYNQYLWLTKNNIDYTSKNLNDIILDITNIINIFKNKKIIHIYIPDQYNELLLYYHFPLNNILIHQNTYINIVIECYYKELWLDSYIYDKHIQTILQKENLQIDLKILVEILMYIFYYMSVTYQINDKAIVIGKYSYCV